MRAIDSRVSIAAAIAMVTLSGCMTAAPTRTASPEFGPLTVSHGLTLVTMESVQDWATFADDVVLVRVLSEEKMAVSEEERAAGEGYIPRTITVEVRRTLWSQPAIDRAVPLTMTLEQGAWLFGRDRPERRVLADLKGSWGQVGHDYVVAIAYSGFGPAESAKKKWGVLTMLPADGGVVGNGEAIVGDALTGSFVSAVKDAEVSNVTKVLAAASPYPKAVKVMDRDLSVRASSVNSE